MSSRMKRTMLVLGIGAAMLYGCASTPAPVELVEARRAYNRVHDGPAQALVPAQVLAAQQALNRAEQAYMDAPDAQRTKDLAYIAHRKAQLAEAQAAIVVDHRDGQQAAADVDQMRKYTQERTTAELSQARAEVASAREVLSAKDDQLTAEQRARRAAEKRASDAIASLEKIAMVKEEERGLVITLNGAVLFATGQSTLLPIAADRLQQVAEALNDNPQGKIVVEGHTDSTGPLSLNEELSRRRAEAVREFLVHHGVAADRIRAAGLGPSRPVADNKSPEGRANNRRVEIVIER